MSYYSIVQRETKHSLVVHRSGNRSKSLKKSASMGKAPTKTLATQATHFFAAVLAYTKLEVLQLKCGIGHFRLKAQRYAVGLKAMYLQLGQLRA